MKEVVILREITIKSKNFWTRIKFQISKVSRETIIFLAGLSV